MNAVSVEVDREGGYLRCGEAGRGGEWNDNGNDNVGVMMWRGNTSRCSEDLCLAQGVVG